MLFALALLLCCFSCITEHRVSLVERRKKAAPIDFDEVLVPAGSFIVGSLARIEERPLQHVEISHSFKMMKGESLFSIFMSK